jgi:Spy/CpxP family protein refolding chaperone
MKTYFIIAILFSGITTLSFSQQRSNNPYRVDHKELRKTLELNDKQIKAWDKADQEMNDEMKAILENQDTRERGRLVSEARRSHEKKLLSVLTPEQVTKYHEIMTEKKAARRDAAREQIEKRMEERNNELKENQGGNSNEPVKQ